MNPEQLAQLPLFAGLSPAQLSLLSTAMQGERRVKHESVFRSGEESHSLYLIERGYVNLTTDSGLTVATLGPGSILGEADLFRSTPRSINAVAAGETELWSLTDHALQELLRRQPLIGIRLSQNFGEPLVHLESYLVDRLSEVPALGDLPAQALANLAQRLQPQEVAAHSRLYRAHEEPQGLFLVEAGRLNLQTADAEGESLTEPIYPGDMLGALAFLTHKPYNHDAVAAEASLIWFLSAADFQAVNSHFPSLRRNLSRHVQARLDGGDQLKAVVRLAQMRLFAEMSPQSLQAIAQRLMLEHVSAGEPVYRSDEMGDALFLVEQGEIELTTEKKGGVVEEVARVQAGGFFGEMSLLTGKNRDEEATATEDTNLWVLYKSDLDALIGQYPALGTALSQGLAARLAEAENRVDESRLGRFILFANLAPSELRQVAQHLRPTRYRAGEQIYRVGSRGDTMYLIERGQVRLQPQTGSSWVLDQGDFFGEKALLTGQPRSVSTFADTDVDLWLLRQSDLETLMVQHPNLAINLSRTLSRRLTQPVANQEPAPGQGPVYVSPTAARRRRTAAASSASSSSPRPRFSLAAWFAGLSMAGKLRLALLLLLLIWLLGVAAPATLLRLTTGTSVAAGAFVPVSTHVLSAVSQSGGVAVAMAAERALVLSDQLLLADQAVAPTPTYTPLPTETPVPTDTPTVTPTVTPTPTETLAPTPAATNTPLPPPPQPAAVQQSAPVVAAAAAAAAAAPPPAPAQSNRIWDPRLTQLGTRVDEAQVAPGQPYWRLIEARWENEQEGGGKHHIYVEVMDESGNRLPGQPVTVSWGGGSDTKATENKPAPDYAYNFQMYAPGNSYDVRVENLPSDTFRGAGLGDLELRGWNIHVNYILIYQRAVR